MATMRTHSKKGAELIAKYKDFSHCARVIRYHHENWDASGYRVGLKEYEIPFGAVPLQSQIASILQMPCLSGT